MSPRSRLGATARDRLPAAPLSRADAPWLGGALLVGVAAAVLYLALNPYPAYGAGLYTVVADEIRAAGYALPATIPHYTAEGVPFAYPPLAFYGLALARDLGAGTFATARFVPPAFVVAALMPAYLLGRDLLGRDVVDGRLRGAAAGLLVACNPQILEWHVSAGGLVRAPAFLVSLVGAYAGLRLFRDRESGWLPVGLAGFALVVLTHPTYALFYATTYVVFWLGYDRTLRGLARGAVVGFGGLALAAPWWATVASVHGPAVFLGAAGTHGGVGGGLVSALVDGMSPWSAVPLLAGGVLLVAGWRVLPAWLFVSELLFEQPRFAYTVGAFALVGAAIVAVDRVSWGRATDAEARRRVAVAALVVVASVGVGALGYEFGGPTDDTTPAFVDDDDVEAMAWAARETPDDAAFVALGDAAEWFPAVADRTILVAPWGVEWRGPADYQRHLHAFENASTCESAACLAEWTATVDADPDYLYVPRGEYTVRGDRYAASGALERSLAATGRYDPVFENEGVVVYRVHEG
ncbi:ArnT family glycosyltransferase [Halorussus halobius]|uniref:ArnT family glycosyltransferase n=1 Tax=Halorussus halobius TaxID=1710537 RepID=UPI001092FF3D|nr:glycosyltransferase family 39 protein [Halorussus halobius]